MRGSRDHTLIIHQNWGEWIANPLRKREIHDNLPDKAVQQRAEVLAPGSGRYDS